MPDKFFLVEKTRGYITKPDPTNSPFNVLIAPSQNVLINDADKVSTRLGYTLLGSASTATTPIESSYDWENSTGGSISLRAYDDELEIYNTTLAAWVRLKDSLSSVALQFAKVYDSTEGIDILVWVDGTDNLYEWSGGIAVIKSTTSTTITKTGTGSWAESRFFTAGTRKVIINGTEYEYNAGETGTVLTVTTNPTGEANGSNVFQAVRSNADTPAADFLSTGIRVLNNQLWIYSSTSRQVYVSSNTDHTDYTVSSPRASGEGALLTLDNVPKALAVQDKDMYISAGRDDWYKSEFEEILLSTDTIAETLAVKKLKTTTGMGARSQDLTLEAGDFVAFIDHNNALRILGNVEDVETPLIKSFSNPIKPDLDDADFTNGHLIWDKNRIYISAPNDDLIYILETRENADGTVRRFWQPPQIIPIRRWAIISGVIHGHSNAAPETYKLFDGTNDNGNSIRAIAAYSYRNYKRRDLMKVFDEWVTEGYISANTQLTLRLNYDYEGSTQQLEKIIRGDNDAILFQPEVGGIIGTERTGTSRIGAGRENAGNPNPKFRVFNEFVTQDFFEIQAIYESDNVDQQWEIISNGGNIKLSKNIPMALKPV